MQQELPPPLKMFYRWRLTIAATGVLVTLGMGVTWWLIDGSLLGLVIVPFGVLIAMLSMALFWLVNRGKLEPMGFRW